MKSGGVDLVRLGGENARRLGEALANPPETDDSGAETLAFRASGRLDQLPRFAAAAQRAAGAGGYRLAVAAHAGSGVPPVLAQAGGRGGERRPRLRTFAVLSREGSDPGRGGRCTFASKAARRRLTPPMERRAGYRCGERTPWIRPRSI